MKAIILCAGKGTRLPEISSKMPKVMVDIAGKPLLQWQIEHLRDFGVTDIYINLHYLPDMIKGYFKDGKKFGVNITYSYEKILSGTGGALTYFRQFIDDTTLLIYGDVLNNINFKKLEKFHKEKKSILTAVVRNTDHPVDSDLVGINKDKCLINFYPKPHKSDIHSAYGLSAIYLFEASMLELLPRVKVFDFAKDFLPTLIAGNYPVYCFESKEFIMDIGTPERYKKIRNLGKLFI